jgi:molybdopterin synthase sulfur carrier subunit
VFLPVTAGVTPAHVVGHEIDDVRLIARGGIHAQVLASGRAVRCALNQVMVDESSPVPDGAEVAFFPPVTGG